MMQVNLLPDVKRDLLRAQIMRNLIIVISAVVAGASILAVVMILGVIGTQNLLIGSKDKEIETKFSELQNIEDVNATVILQSQLSEIDKIRLAAPEMSRLARQVVVAIKTTGSKEVQFTSVKYDPATFTVTIDGQSDQGYAALEALQKTIKETKVLYRTESKGNSCTYDEAIKEQNGCVAVELLENGEVTVLQQAYGDDNETGGKKLSFSISFIINKDTLAFASKDLSVKSPARKDVTDSKTVIPSDTFTGKSTEEENQ